MQVLHKMTYNESRGVLANKP